MTTPTTFSDQLDALHKKRLADLQPLSGNSAQLVAITDAHLKEDIKMLYDVLKGEGGTKP